MDKEKILDPYNHLKKNYGKVGSIVSFLSPYKIYLFYNRKIKLKEIKNFLESSESYSLLKHEQAVKIFNKTITFHWRDVLQVDLFYIDRLKDENDGVRFILTGVDVFTRFGFCEPLINKSAREVTNKLEIIFNRLGVLPKVVCSDKGSEFKNQYTETFLKKHKIKIFYAQTDPKAACVERLQKTFQLLIYKYLVEKETYRYIDVLQQLMRNYNETPHSFLENLSPALAENPENWDRVSSAHSKHYARLRTKKIKPCFKIGDIVRVSLIKSKFRRAYDISHSYQRYIVHEIDKKHLVPLFILKNENDQILTGKFYGSQLQKINIETYRSYPIKERKTKKGKEYLMRFIGYNEEYDQWLPANQLEKI